jgi:hypothetical protein|tara:strand:- start:4442 stop:5416 length:975 start_codon:yes stop_codon:yes gene_type:complete
MGIVYGQPKRMKTSMVASAFPGALWVPGEGANAITSVCRNEWGFDPIVYEHPIRTLVDLIDLLTMLEEQGLVSDFPAVCVDGMTALCEASLRFWSDNPRLTSSGKVDKFYPYQQLKDKLLRLAERARHIGVSVFLVAHEQAPGAGMDGSFVPGGPSLGSKGQVVRVPAWCDFNGRAVVNGEYPDPWVKGGLYVDPWDSNWVTGDRNGVAYASSPPNVRELLRASAVDYKLGRLPGLEWQDDVADIVAAGIMKNGDVQAAIDRGVNAGQQQAKGTGREPQLHIRWAVQDGIARGVIEKQRSASLFKVVPPPASPAKGKTPPPPSE